MNCNIEIQVNGTGSLAFQEGQKGMPHLPDPIPNSEVLLEVLLNLQTSQPPKYLGTSVGIPVDMLYHID